MSGVSDHPDRCPHCGADLRGDPIPEEYLHLYGGETHYSHIIGVEWRGYYDGILYWRCAECGGSWHRFPVEDKRMRELADMAMEARLQAERKYEAANRGE